jgi:hypothetical protein
VAAAAAACLLLVSYSYSKVLLPLLSLTALFYCPPQGRKLVTNYACVGNCELNQIDGDGCYILTNDELNEVGAVWGSEPVDITSSFDISARLYFGTKEDGADGIAFVIQNAAGDTSVGSDGGNLGFLDIGDYFAVDVDTYWNHNLDGEMKEDHVYISSKRGGFGSSVAIANVEDGSWHTFRVTWNAGTGALDVYLGGATVATATVSSISDELANASTATFGFTAATGGYKNLQKICNVTIPEGSAGAAIVPTVVVEPTLLSPCDNFAVHGTTAITFGATNVVHNGDVGCITSAAITETAYLIDDGFAQHYGGVEGTQCAEAKVEAVIAFHSAGPGSEYTEIPATMGGETFTPGKYYSPATLSTAADETITLDGAGDYTFQAYSTLGTGARTKFNLINGAKAENVLWEVGTAATIGAGTISLGHQWVGTIIAGSAISVGADVELYGRMLAVTAITFGANQMIDATSEPPVGPVRYLRQ